MSSEVPFVIEAVKDLNVAFPVLRALLEELHDYHLPMWPRPFRSGWEEEWREHIRLGEDRLVLLARDGEYALGYVSAGIQRNPTLFEETFCQIGEAYVRPKVRRHGLGAALVAQVEAWCRSRGVEELRLGVVAANEIGVAFWRKAGFEPLTHTMLKVLKR